MTEIEEDQKSVRQYLLGDLEGEQRLQFEEQLFADSDAFERVLMIEDELIEDYIFDLLPVVEERKFVEHFLSTPRQIQKLGTAQALKEYSERTSRTPSHKERIVTFFIRRRQLFATVALATILVAGLVGIWSLTRVSLDQEVARLNAAGPGELNGGINQSEQVITLVPIRVRSEGETDLVESVSISPGTPVMQLRLQLAGDEYRDYQLILQREPDSRIFTLGNLKARETANGKLLVVRAPTRIFSPGEYRLLLIGATADSRKENLGSYALRIVSVE